MLAPAGACLGTESLCQLTVYARLSERDRRSQITMSEQEQSQRLGVSQKLPRVNGSARTLRCAGLVVMPSPQAERQAGVAAVGAAEERSDGNALNSACDLPSDPSRE